MVLHSGNAGASSFHFFLDPNVGHPFDDDVGIYRKPQPPLGTTDPCSERIKLVGNSH